MELFLWRYLKFAPSRSLAEDLEVYAMQFDRFSKPQGPLSKDPEETENKTAISPTSIFEVYKSNYNNRHCEEERRSNPRFANPPCIVRDCFVPRNDGFYIFLNSFRRNPFYHTLSPLNQFHNSFIYIAFFIY